MIDRLSIINERYEEINEELLKPEVLEDYSKQMKLFQEKSSLEEIVNKYSEYQKTLEEIEGLKIMLSDPDMSEVAASELALMSESLENLTKELEFLLIPKDENDGKNIIMEIRGAAGGDEANIFAGDLFRMYTRYAESEGWKTEMINAMEGSSGGFSQIEFSITGSNVYSKLKFESGAHRVQRVPQTETQGRVHTSTATVVVMPEAEDVDVELKNDDIRVDVYRASGKGGQGVNTTDSAVRITHIPTGTVVTCQNERSQIKNKEYAMKVLISKLEQQAYVEQNESINNMKSSKNIEFGSQIRNYTLEPYKLVKDTRTGYETSNTDAVLNGNILPFMQEYLKDKR